MPANVGTLTAHIGLDTKMLSVGAARSQGIFRRLSGGAVGGLSRITGAFGGVGVALGGLTAALGSGMLLRNIGRIGIAFEQSMTTAGAVMRATSEEMAMLTAKARELGESTEWSASQAADALKFLGMAGFDATKAAAALPGTLDLATAGSLDLGRAADIATNALTAMGLPVEGLTRVNDVFVGTITRSNTNMEMMAESFKYAAPLGKAFGYTIEELSGMIGTLGNAGIQGSMAGTQLAMAMQKANDIAVRFKFDSADLIDVLKDLRRTGRTNADIMKLFGQRAGRAALVLADNADAARDLQKTLHGVSGEAKTLADKMRDTVGGAFKELKSVLEEVAIATFDEFRDKLKGWVTDVTEWVRDNKDAIVTIGSTIVTVLGGILEAIATFIDKVSEATRKVVEFFTNTRDEAKETEVAIAEMATGIADVGEELTAAEWKRRQLLNPPVMTGWDRFSITIEHLGNRIVKLAESIGIFFLDIFTLIFDSLAQAGGVIGKVFADMAGYMKPGLEAIKVQWAATMDSLGPPDAEQIFHAKWLADIERRYQELLAIEKAAAKQVGKVREFAPGKEPEEITLGGEGTIDTIKQVLSTQVMLYRELLNETGRTKTELLQVWEDYAEVREKQITAEGEHLVKTLKLPKEFAEQIKGLRMRQLLKEQKKLFSDHGNWLEDWAKYTARSMNNAMSTFFFDAMKGEAKKTMDYLEMLWDDTLRYISRRASEELTDELFKKMKPNDSGAGGGGWGSWLSSLFGGGGTEVAASGALSGGGSSYLTDPYAGYAIAQHGGIATKPTMALVGESGPEAIIPLAKFNDPRFWQGFNESHGGNVTVNMNIQTPDVAGFRASQSQIASGLGVALSQARRRA